MKNALSGIQLSEKPTHLQKDMHVDAYLLMQLSYMDGGDDLPISQLEKEYV